MKVFATLRNFATTLPVAVGRLQGFPKGVYLSVTGPLQRGTLGENTRYTPLGHPRYEPVSTLRSLLIKGSLTFDHLPPISDIITNKNGIAKGQHKIFTFQSFPVLHFCKLDFNVF